MKLGLSIVTFLFAFTANDHVVMAQTPCSVCPVDSKMMEPENPIFFLEGSPTCGDFEDSISNLDADRCSETLVTGALLFVDLASFCGCTSSGAESYDCAICGGGTVTTDTTEIPFFSEVVGVSMSCQSAGELASYVTDADFCSTLSSAVSSICCEGVDPSTAGCSICPESSTMEAGSRQFYTLEGAPTCNDIEALLSTIAGDQCGALLTSLSVIDAASYCGCSGVDPPGICSACGASELSSAQTVDLGFGIDTTLNCDDASTLVEYVTNDLVCTAMSTVVEAVCCPSSSFGCSICPESSTMTLGDRQLYTLPDSPTCSDAQSQLSDLPTDACEEVLNSLSFMDYAAYCGCSGVDAPDVCSACGAAAVDDITTNVDIGMDFDISLDCSGASTLAEYITDDLVCTGVSSVVKSACCPAPPSNEECSICANGGAIGAPSRKVLIIRDGPSCADLEVNVQNLDSTECQSYKNTLSVLDSAAYCECTGATVPGTCSLCTGSASVSEPTKNIQAGPFGLSMTCEEAQTITDYITSESLCSAMQAVAAPLCCFLPAETTVVDETPDASAETPDTAATPDSGADQTASTSTETKGDDNQAASTPAPGPAATTEPASAPAETPTPAGSAVSRIFDKKWLSGLSSIVSVMYLL